MAGMRNRAMAALQVVALLCGGMAGAAAQPQGQSQWWVGFIDLHNRAFLEIPGDAKACAARDMLARRGAGGRVLTAPLRPESQLPPGSRLVFGVTDLAGVFAERVLTRVVAVAHEDEGRRRALRAACWLLAEAGTDVPGYLVTEDRLAFGTHPPRALVVRAVDAAWRGYGPLADAPGADARFAPGADMPAGWRHRIATMMPAVAQAHAQPFTAILDPRRGPEPMVLIGAIDDAAEASAVAGTYNTVNLIVRESREEVLYLAGPSGGVGKSYAASFVAQVAAVVDLDGDGVDELVIRARYFAGGNLKILKWSGSRYVEVRGTGYEGD